MLPRSQLASLVCPSTPFLVPRLLRAPVPIALLSTPCSTATGPSSLQRRTYAARAKGHKKKGPNKDSKGQGNPNFKKFRPKDETELLLEQFRANSNVNSVSEMMSLYPAAVASKKLQPNDSRRLAQALHAAVRNSRAAKIKASDLFPFVDRVVEDIRSGALPPHPFAHVHLIGIYKHWKKFQQGHDFWQWLVQQNELYVDPSVYGAAIELMAYGGMAELQELESLYMDALSRFPGTFAEYHLSPDAIVPDRSQPTFFTGLPMSLLQGILTARILNRDWKNAYLALDTGLRLYPTQLPARFFELFMTERPVSEAYSVYLIACRAGIVFKPSHLTVLMAKLKQAMAVCTSLQARITILQGTANAIYAYLQSGGSLEPLHVGILLSNFEVLLPDLAVGETYEGDLASFRNVIMTTAHEFASTMLQAGMPPSPHLFAALISLAGKLKVPSLLESVVGDVEEIRLDLADIGRRTVVTSAGMLNNKELLERYWSQIVSQADAESRRIAYEDWITLAKACRRCSHINYFYAQLQANAHAIDSRAEERCNQELTKQDITRPDRDLELMDMASFNSAMEGFKEHSRNIAAVTMAGRSQDLRTTPFPMFLNAAKQPLGTTHDLRTVYDEFTTDPNQPSPPAPQEGTKPVSATGIPLDELRFENWVTVVTLLNDAEANEVKMQKLVDRAIAEKKPLVRTALSLDLSTADGSLYKSVDGLRNRIRELRNPNIIISSSPSTDALDSPQIRRVESISLEEALISGTASKPKPKPSRKDAEEVPVQHGEGESASPIPSLSYYISMESHHIAPQVKYQPLKKRAAKDPNDLSLQLDDEGQVNGDSKGNSNSTTSS
ncbi:hypothetical protein BS50DRAFT_556973 [Corynespora cassiicola Philippines]|uniref:Uncharacterized protein n=1 Tax=Corynespora cassiicola Philippines TaxID=1448308 RepID=A0A2T2NG90_CORCC|nr:hypothetical protein BS50DRAFT_556973 [Corynespora cassiicola Philippines]